MMVEHSKTFGSRPNKAEICKGISNPSLEEYIYSRDARKIRGSLNKAFKDCYLPISCIHSMSTIGPVPPHGMGVLAYWLMPPYIHWRVPEDRGGVSLPLSNERGQEKQSLGPS